MILKPAVSLFILFVLASGLSAYIGNEWGRKLGKRKLSIFKLRPKHTSMFLTVLISMALSLGLLGSFLLAFPTVQESLLSPENQQIAELERYQQQSAEISATLAQLNKNSQQQRQQPLATPEQIQAKPEKSPVQALQLANSAPVPTRRQPFVSQKPRLKQSQALPAANPPKPKERLQIAVKPRLQPRLNQPKPATDSKPLLEKKTATVPANTSDARPDRLAMAQSSQSVQPKAEATTTYASNPIFKFSVYGDLSPEESRQVLEGTLEMTRNYVTLAGLQNGTARLAIQSTQLQQAQQRLQKPGSYAIEIRLAEVNGSSLPVNLQIKSEQVSSDFDPNSLMESARLNSPQAGNQFRQDLRLALKNLAKDHRSDPRQGVSPGASGATLEIQSASLPFDLLNLRREQGTLLGTVIFSRSDKNLTQN